MLVPEGGALVKVSVVPLTEYAAVGACVTPEMVTSKAVSLPVLMLRESVKAVVAPLPLNTSSPRIGFWMMLPT